MRILILVIIGIFQLPLAGLLHAETGREAWLRYESLKSDARSKYASLPASVVVLGNSIVLERAQDELIHGIRGMLGRTLRKGKGSIEERAFVLGTFPALRKVAPSLRFPSVGEDGYWLSERKIGEFSCIMIASPNDRGVLYGVFALLRKIALEKAANLLDEVRQPNAPVRWVNQWDNLNGTIERGYGGP